MKIFKKANIALIGSNGLIGREFIKILLENSNFINVLKIFANFDLDLKNIKTNIKFYVYKNVLSELFLNIDIIILCLNKEDSIKYVNLLFNDKIFFIDKSDAYRNSKEALLIGYNINHSNILDSNLKIISNPNCVVIPIINIINNFLNLGILNLFISTYQAVSGAGYNGVYELENQIKNFYIEKKNNNHVFQDQILFNLLPSIPINSLIDNNNNCEEEIKIISEISNILKLSKDIILANCCRVPVLNSHSGYINLIFKKKISKEIIYSLLLKNKFIKIIDDKSNNIFPSPNYSNLIDLILVGKIKISSFNDKNILSLWFCSNNLRVGSVINTFNICKYLCENKIKWDVGGSNSGPTD